MSSLRKLRPLFFLLTSMAVLIFFIFIVDPSGKPLVYILIPVLLFWVVVFAVFSLIGDITSLASKKLWSIGSFIGASSLTLIVLFSGVGQLSFADLLLVGLLVVVSSFYFYRTWS